MVLPTPDRYLKQTCQICGASYVSHQPTDVLYAMAMRCDTCGGNDFAYDFFTRPRSASLLERIRELFH